MAMLRYALSKPNRSFPVKFIPRSPSQPTLYITASLGKGHDCLLVFRFYPTFYRNGNDL